MTCGLPSVSRAQKFKDGSVFTLSKEILLLLRNHTDFLQNQVEEPLATVISLTLQDSLCCMPSKVLVHLLSSF